MNRARKRRLAAAAAWAALPQLLPGEAVGTRALLEAEAARPLGGPAAPPPAGGLFDAEAQAQADFFDPRRPPS